MREMPEITRAEVLTIQPGDRLVLTYPHRVTPEMMGTLREFMERAFPGVPCVVLEEGATLQVVRDAQ